MWAQRLMISFALTVGTVLGFVLSSCMTPSVEGQTGDFPPLIIGETYQFAGNFGRTGVLNAVGPYPWVEVVVGDNVYQVNLDNIGTIGPAAKEDALDY